MTETGSNHQALKLSDPELVAFSRDSGVYTPVEPHNSQRLESNQQMKMRLAKELESLADFRTEAAQKIETKISRSHIELEEAKNRLLIGLNDKVEGARKEIQVTLEYLDSSPDLELKPNENPLIRALQSSQKDSPIFKYNCGSNGLDLAKYIFQELYINIYMVDLKKICGHSASSLRLSCGDDWCEACISSFIIQGTEGLILTNSGEVGYKTLRCPDCNSKLTKLDIKKVFGYTIYKAKKHEANLRSGLAYVSVISNSPRSLRSEIELTEMKDESDSKSFVCDLCRLTKPLESGFMSNCECKKLVCKACTVIELNKFPEVHCPACWKELMMGSNDNSHNVGGQFVRDLIADIEENKGRDDVFCTICSEVKAVNQAIGTRCCRATICRDCLMRSQDWPICFVCSQLTNPRDLDNIKQLVSVTLPTPQSAPESYQFEAESFAEAKSSPETVDLISFPFQL